jgi:hypothetical protein
MAYHLDADSVGTILEALRGYHKLKTIRFIEKVHGVNC